MPSKNYRCLLAKSQAFALLFFGFLYPELTSADEIFHLVEGTKLVKYSDIHFFARTPPAHYNQNDNERGYDSKSKVSGVLALLTWSSDPEDVKENLAPNGRFKTYVNFADKHNLALVTWTNFKGYKTNLSGDITDEDALKDYEKSYDQRAREWRNGFKRLCRKYNLPSENVMMYGISGGGQMAHRLALRMPEFFFSVHIHVNSSYDIISRDGKDILWLVSTGTLEYGYPAGIRFYREALRRGYHMIFRAEENLGHRGSAETLKTSLAFFEYCMKFLPDAADPNWRRPPVDQFYLMRYPTFIGDYINGEVFTREAAPK